MRKSSVTAVLAAVVMLVLGARDVRAAAPKARATETHVNQRGAPKNHAARAGRRASVERAAGRLRAASTTKAAAPERAGSVGHPNEGRLENGVHLDLSRPYLRVVPAYAPGDVRWGMPALVHAIERAAKGVAKRFPGSVLPVGDISRRGGGDIVRHRSHESGRDADIGFYAVDAKGKQVFSNGFTKFDSSLASTNVPGARFDLPRNWLLVEKLLTDPVARVSHIFIAEPLRQRLLAHARSRGVSKALLHRAAVVMMQPTQSLPHDDHMHVRISCPRGSQGSCIELAKNAPMGKHSVRRRGQTRAGVTRTVKKHSGVAAPKAREDRHSTKAALPRKVEPSAQTALESEALFDEAEADAVEVRDAIDESGAAKITD